MANAQTISRIAIIGFGEVGGIFGTDFAAIGIEVSVFDILLASESHRQPMLDKARTCGVKPEDSLRNCVCGADLVISAVTASSALAVAQEAGSVLQPQQLFLDINSVSPETKRKARACLERDSGRSGGRFVEAAVMAAVPQVVDAGGVPGDGAESEQANQERTTHGSSP